MEQKLQFGQVLYCEHQALSPSRACVFALALISAVHHVPNLQLEKLRREAVLAEIKLDELSVQTYLGARRCLDQIALSLLERASTETLREHIELLTSGAPIPLPEVAPTQGSSEPPSSSSPSSSASAKVAVVSGAS